MTSCSGEEGEKEEEEGLIIEQKYMNYLLVKRAVHISLKILNTDATLLYHTQLPSVQHNHWPRCTLQVKLAKNGNGAS